MNKGTRWVFWVKKAEVKNHTNGALMLLGGIYLYEIPAEWYTYTRFFVYV
jgi:hypothetical protein